MPGRRIERRRATVLDRTKLGEQDLIITALSQEGEQIRAVAKGARKPGSRLAARTELFCDVDLLLSLGRGLPIVSEASLLDAHMGVRKDVESVSAASTICETARLTCYENVDDPFLHPILNRALLAIEQADDRAHQDVVVAAYVLKVLSHGGWRPELGACVACGEPDASRFSVLWGGVVCESCAQTIEGAEPMAPGHIAWLRALIGSTFDTLLCSDADETTADFLLATVHSWAATHLDSRLRAFEFHRGVL